MKELILELFAKLQEIKENACIMTCRSSTGEHTLDCNNFARYLYEVETRIEELIKE